MADPNPDAPRHPPHPGNSAGKIPDAAGARRGGGRRAVVVLAVLVFVLAVGWLLIGGGEQFGDETLGEPAGVGESAASVEQGADEPELPHGAIGEASEADTVLAPEAVDADATAESEPE